LKRLFLDANVLFIAAHNPSGKASLLISLGTDCLLIPNQQAVEVWPASGDAQHFESLAELEATPEFAGLQLQLAEIWAG